MSQLSLIAETITQEIQSQKLGPLQANQNILMLKEIFDDVLQDGEVYEIELVRVIQHLTDKDYPLVDIAQTLAIINNSEKTLENVNASHDFKTLYNHNTNV
jgi:hypothetical protein